MKNFKNVVRMSLAIIIGLCSFTPLLANDSSEKKEESKETRYLAEVSSESELDKLERDLISEGVLLCDNITIVKILDEQDQLIYEGQLSAFDSQDVDLKRWMAKADFILNVDNTSYYKIF